MMRRFLTLTAFSAGCFSLMFSFGALAQEGKIGVELRASVQSGFTRFVFSGDELPEIAFAETAEDTLTLTFSKAVALSGDTVIQTIQPTPKITTTDDGMNVVLFVPGLERQRNLRLGKRVLLDVFTSETPQDVEAVSSPIPQTVQSLPETKIEAKPEKRETLKLPEEVSVIETPEEPTPAPVVQKEQEPEKSFTGTATITIGSTQGLSMTVFERKGYLWMVTSRQSLGVPPLVSGPSAQQLEPIDTVAIQGGSAYRMKMPKGAHVRPEGGGLVWRLVIEDKRNKLRSVILDRDFQSAAGPVVNVPMQGVEGVFRLPDPLIGDDLAVITVNRASTRLGKGERFVDFEVIPALVGAVIRPLADGLSIAVQSQDVNISRRNGGLRMSATGARGSSSTKKTTPIRKEGEKKISRVFSFDEWGLGGPDQFLEMRRSIDERLASADEDRKLVELLNGTKFMLAQGLPQEATGFMNMAYSFMPLLRESAEFQALKGAVSALRGDADIALEAFKTQGLENNDEVNLWTGFALASQGKLTEAHKVMPRDARLISTYPSRIQTLMIPTLLDAVFARGDVSLAENLIDLYAQATDPRVYLDYDNALSYFRGRVSQLRGDQAGAAEYYRQASEGTIGPYPVLATLTLVERGLSNKTIERKDAIAKLEQFRFGWRSGSLESRMLEELGMIYVTGGEQRRGLTILRDAATMASNEKDREKLVAVMQKAFKELFSGKTVEKMTAMESASVASEFAELMPAGGEGEKITMNIANQMVKVDLLDRAAGMVEPMVTRTKEMNDALTYAGRAASIRLLDRRSRDALKILDKALARDDVVAAGKLPAKDLRAFALLRARAKADLGRTDEAFAELRSIPEDKDTLKLMADTAWKAQRWGVAADSFAKLVGISGLDATRPLTKAQAQMILNWALALNLGGNEAGLDQLRLTHGDIMRRSELSRAFQMVTRTAREATLADRETLLSLVSEVDMFKDVLESYRTHLPSDGPLEDEDLEKMEKTDAVAAPVPSEETTEKPEP